MSQSHWIYGEIGEKIWRKNFNTFDPKKTECKRINDEYKECPILVQKMTLCCRKFEKFTILSIY